MPKLNTIFLALALLLPIFFTVTNGEGNIMKHLFDLVKSVTIGAVGIAGAVALGLYWFQDRLLYLPGVPQGYKRPEDNPPGYRSPGDLNLPFEDLTLTAADGVKLHCWFVKQADVRSRPTFLYLQANAGNMGFRLPDVSQLHHDVQVNVFMLSYRGYGNSEGVPNEKGITLDAEAALNYLRSRPDVDPNTIFVFGRSLGGAVSFRTALNHPTKVRGIIVENTFASISEMVDVVFPLLAPFKGLVLRIGWRSIDAVKVLNHPALFISGLKDEIVPAAQMQRLISAMTRSVYKDVFIIPNGTHNDTHLKAGRDYYTRIKSFVEKVLKDNLTPSDVRGLQSQGAGSNKKEE
eukprot:GILI01006576.1.p1 GENE.GILI01006576.1~~GILI01006576.1.p1  ORF type:complete len:348 (-),score=98.81 GILI01006576.1:447-1490(-)